MKRFGISVRHFNRLTKKAFLESDLNSETTGENLPGISVEVAGENPPGTSSEEVFNEQQTLHYLDCDENLDEDNEFQPPLSSDVEDYSSDEDDHSTVTSSKLQQGLSQWVSECNVTHSQTNKLLKVLHSCNVENNLPKCAKTLMSTPRQKIVTRSVAPGEYYHFGIQKYFLNCNNRKVLEMNEIILDIGIDGLPLFQKSSQLKLWPIIGAIAQQKNLPLFLIGSYSGRSAPKSSCDFLKDFVDEVKLLQANGILVGTNEVSKTFRIRLFSCDAPARAFISCTIGHTGKHGCSKCCQVGTKPHKSGIIYQTEICELRTDHSFKNRDHCHHHLSKFQSAKSSLETIDIGMVSQIPIDPMHLFDLGVTRRILMKLFTNKSVGYRPNITKISEDLLKYSSFVPAEFQRKPRSLNDLHYWKATEFRQFVLYTGIAALKDNVNDDIYYHFLTLHCAYRILSCPRHSTTNIDSAQILLQNFVDNYSHIYGSDQITYNVHNLLHVSECVRQFGPADSFSAYKFENYMQSLKKKIRKPNCILQQLHNRIFEDNTHIPKNNSNSPNSKQFDEFLLNFDKEADCFCLISPNIPIKVSGFGKNGNSEYIVGFQCQNISSFFEEPIDSSVLGIICYENISNVPEFFEINLVQQKYFRIPHGNKYLLIPIINSSFHSFSS